MSEVTGMIERKYMAHYVDTTFKRTVEGTPSWYRLGEDLEEYNIELNPDTEITKNILGNTKFKHSGYEPSADASPFYAHTDDALFEHLQEIVDKRHTGDQLKTSTLEVHLWEDGTSTGSFVAYRQFCYLSPTSYGGDTSGYQIPFTVNYVGDRYKGEFVPNATTGGGTFTPDA